uniref:Uncharacterized protein n=1 Tax=Cucumis melo TaxID=3656 RepID=A0A9I9EH35_CUCME
MMEQIIVIKCQKVGFWREKTKRKISPSSKTLTHTPLSFFKIPHVPISSLNTAIGRLLPFPSPPSSKTLTHTLLPVCGDRLFSRTTVYCKVQKNFMSMPKIGSWKCKIMYDRKSRSREISWLWEDGLGNLGKGAGSKGPKLGGGGGKLFVKGNIIGVLVLW